MGTVYMVFHVLTQFWLGSAEAVSVATIGVAMSATHMAAPAMTLFISWSPV